jgi:hypothetical protein
MTLLVVVLVILLTITILLCNPNVGTFEQSQVYCSMRLYGTFAKSLRFRRIAPPIHTLITNPGTLALGYELQSLRSAILVPVLHSTDLFIPQGKRRKI